MNKLINKKLGTTALMVLFALCQDTFAKCEMSESLNDPSSSQLLKSFVEMKDELNTSKFDALTENFHVVENEDELSTSEYNVLAKSFVELGDDTAFVSPLAGIRIASFDIDEIKEAEMAVNASYEYKGDYKKYTHETREALALKGSKVDYFGDDYGDGGTFITHADGTAHLAFRGSSNWDNWFKNGGLKNIYFNGGKYHGGFFEGYRSTKGAVWNLIEKFAASQNMDIPTALNKITVTGHSRGAAIATVFSDVTRRDHGVAMRTVTFEAPRALHKHTAAEYNLNAKDVTLNIAQKDDPVHYVNFAGFAGDAHVGQKLYLPLHKCTAPHLINGFSEALSAMQTHGSISADGRTYKFEAFQENRDLASEEDHSIQAYVERAGYAVMHPLETTGNALYATGNAIIHPIDTTIDLASRAYSVGAAGVNLASTTASTAWATTKIVTDYSVRGTTYAVMHPITTASMIGSGLKRLFWS